MKLPWMKLFTRDWLDSKELRRCSGMSRSILMDLMCLAHEGERYGYLEDAIGPLTDDFMASRCTISVPELLKAVSELTRNQRLKRDGDSLFVSRMVADEEIRVKRASGGHLGGNPKLCKVNLQDNHKVNLQDNHKVNLQDNGKSQVVIESATSENEGYPCGYPSFEVDSRARASAESESVSSSLSKPQIQQTSDEQFGEIVTAFDRHEKHSNREEKNFVIGMVAGMNGDFDWARFRSNHEQYCQYWSDVGWQFCTLTFLGWVRNGMPPAPQKSVEKFNKQSVIDQPSKYQPLPVYTKPKD